MPYFYVEPEVAGGLGTDTVMDRSVHPPRVSKLHYQLDGWLGDSVLETFPCFIITTDLKEHLQSIGASGAEFDKVQLTTSDQFRQLYPERALPGFAWMKVNGEAGQDDIGTASDGRLVVSARVLEAFEAGGIANALVEPFDSERPN